jgi:uncharacterized protein (TIGR03437 family)
LKKLTLILTSILALAAPGLLSAQTVAVSPTSLTFSALAGSSAQSQAVTVSGSTGILFAISNVPWVKVCSGSGCVGQTSIQINNGALTVIADPTGLSVGQYQNSQAVTIDDSSLHAVANIAVTLTVAPIGVSPSTVAFNYQIGSTYPAAQNLTLTSAPNTPYTTALSGSDCAWLQQPAGGTAPGTVPLAVNTASLPGTAGSHSCTLQFNSGGQTVPVPVTLTVTPPPSVTYSPTSINLVYQIGGTTASSNTPSQTVTITNPGTQALSYFLSPGAPWLTATADPSNLTTIPASGSVHVTIAYVTSSNLAANTYSASVGVLVPGAATNLNIPVSLLISNAPLLNMSTAPVSFSYQVSGAVPGARTVQVTSTAIDPAAPASQQIPIFVTATTSSGGNWLSCQGLSTCSQQQIQGTSFSISLNASVVQALSQGTYNGTVSVFGFNTANATSTSPLTIPVSLKVSNDPYVTATFNGCTMGVVPGLTCPMAFPYQTGQNNPTTQTVTIGSTGAALTATPTVTQNTIAGCPANWLSIGAVTAGANNTSTFTVSANPAGVTNGIAGGCTGTISVAATAASGNASPNSPLSIPVTLYVNNSAMLAVTPAALTFAVAPNQLSANQTITVSSTGTSTSDQLLFTASRPTGDSWLLVDTTPNKSTVAGTVTVAVNTSSLTPGTTYSSNITITATGSGVLDSPVTIPVVLTVTGASMAADKTSLSFNQTVGGTVPASQNVTISATGGTVAYTTAIGYQSGQPTGWLNAAQNGTIAAGSTGAVAVSVNGSSLAAGTYNGTVTISATGVTGSPITVNVTLVVTPGTLAVAPSSLTFSEVQGSAAQTQNVAVSGNPGALNFTMTVSTTDGGNWLSASADQTTTPATLHITANNTGLSSKTYNGTVTITSPGATGSPQTVNVALTVLQAQTVSVSPATLNFNYTIGTSAPLGQTVQVASSGANAQFNAAVRNNTSWLVVTPASGTTNSTPLTVGVNPAGLSAGSYSGFIDITSSASASSPAASITVNLTVVAVPTPVITAIQNAASAIVGAISPGENIVIYGTNIGPAGGTPVMGSIVNGALQTTVAQTQVFFDGIAAPVYYASSGQTSVFVPYGIAGRSTTSIVVKVQGVQSSAINQSVAANVPGVYTLNASGSGPAVAWNYDLKGNFTGINSASIPAVKGGVVSLYVTGEGVTTAPAGVDGAVVTNLYKPLAQVTATVGTQTASVQYAGSAPGSLYGVMQVNIQIPDNAPSGSAVPLVINVGGNNSQGSVTIAIQ